MPARDAARLATGLTLLGRGRRLAGERASAGAASRSLQRPHWGDIMRKALLILLSSVLLHAPAQAGPVEDATSAVTTVLDRFNAGDVDAFFAAHQDGAIIVDEFAPYVWTGAGSAQRWAADYMRDAGARGISGGRVDYSAPIQANGDDATAYVVLPTTYRFVQRGARMAGRGNMTFVMRRDGERWRIASWTYAGSTPAAE
jgi:ketosteroid isomerase-like protein